MSKLISNIVFTKNRPLQLDAYLESLYKFYAVDLVQTYIIYKEEFFSEEYNQLFKRYPDSIIIRESDFHCDFMKVLNGIDTEYVLFGVDDVIYFDSVDIETIKEVFDKNKNDIFGFSLRFGEEIIHNGKDKIYNTDIHGQRVFYIDWTKGQTPNTHYPFELCATVYKTRLIKDIISKSMNNNAIIKKLFLPGSKIIKSLGKITSTRKLLKSFGFFFNPNTLESWPCRWCREHSDMFPKYLYFQKLCASAVQLNMVNDTDRKVFDDSEGYTIESLAQKYKEGFKIDIDYLSQNKPQTTHSDSSYFKLKKNGYQHI